MNLIEQLGGYKKAKDVYKSVDHLRESKTITMSDIGVEFDVGFLRCDLLEYRREHGIFEVGDLVVLINSSDDGVFEYVEYSKGLDLHFFESKNNYGHSKLRNIRHATPAEIQAGKRLN